MKSILFIAFLVCVSSAALFANNLTVNQHQLTFAMEEELVFSDIEIEKIPQKVSEAFAEDNKEAVILKAAVATSTEGVTVYRISIKDAEGETVHFLFKEDGTKYTK